MMNDIAVTWRVWHRFGKGVCFSETRNEVFERFFVSQKHGAGKKAEIGKGRTSTWQKQKFEEAGGQQSEVRSEATQADDRHPHEAHGILNHG
jgi:hypothetical protein